MTDTQTQREGSYWALGQLLQLRIIVLHILLTVASILGTVYWSVTENLESNILNILIRFGSKALLKWIWMVMWSDTIWVFLLFGHKVSRCFGIDKIRMLSEQSMLTLPQWSWCQISLGEILALLTSTGTLPSTSRWHTVFLLSWVSISSSLISGIISEDRSNEQWIMIQLFTWSSGTDKTARSTTV